MMVACHQPNFLPWPGLFFKAMQADLLVLLDDVQFPLGGSWVNRNRLKNDQGELWLTVPVWKRGRGLQRINEVEVCEDFDWRRKHLLSLEHAYKNAPFWREHRDFLMEIYQQRWQHLVELNLQILEYFRLCLGISRPFLKSSRFALAGKGSERLASLCQMLAADSYLTVSSSRKHLDEAVFARHGIKVVYYTYTAPVYPQLWGDFRANLSLLDLLLNCGPKSAEITAGVGRILPC